MRRYCGRPGCSSIAAVTFSFDATARIVWLDDLATGAARAGDLCTRHADALVPPQGWNRVDRRVTETAARVDLAVAPSDPGRGGGLAGPTTAAVETDELLPHREPRRKRRKSPRWSDVPSLFDEPTASPPIVEPPLLELVESDDPSGLDLSPDIDGDPEVAPDSNDSAQPAPAWEPRFDVDDLGGLLDAKSPLLSRAFRAAKATEDTDVDRP